MPPVQLTGPEQGGRMQTLWWKWNDNTEYDKLISGGQMGYVGTRGMFGPVSLTWPPGLST